MNERIIISDPIPAAFKALQDIIAKCATAQAAYMWRDPQWVQSAADIASAASRYRSFVDRAVDNPVGHSDLTLDEIVVRILPAGWRVKDGQIWSTADVDKAELAKARETKVQ